MRSRAAHVVMKTFHQPGNNYRREHKCKCGAFVFSTSWEQHIIDAADALIAPSRPEAEEGERDG